MTNRHIIDRALPERAKLQFWFPNTTEGEEYFVVDVPFFENPQIKESKKARTQKYSLISRSSNLYSYLGADSRKFSVNFNMNLAHILEEHPGLQPESFLKARGSFENAELEKLRFTEGPFIRNYSPATLRGHEYLTESVKESARQVLDSDWASSGITYNEYTDLIHSYDLDRSNFGLTDVAKDRMVEQISTVLYDKGPYRTSFINSMAANDMAGMAKVMYAIQRTFVNTEFDQKEIKNRIIDLIIYWVNIIRCSVINNAQNPIYGPPIIRLNHGIMYQNVPCICTDYSIGWNETAGYDLQTLLPRQLTISLKLEEFRTGNFGKFTGNPNDIIERDNLAGWEAVVLGTEEGTNSLDPGYETHSGESF